MLIGFLVDRTDAELSNGLQGKILLSALTEFVTSVVEASTEPRSKRGQS